MSTALVPKPTAQRDELDPLQSEFITRDEVFLEAPAVIGPRGCGI